MLVSLIFITPHFVRDVYLSVRKSFCNSSRRRARNISCSMGSYSKDLFHLRFVLVRFGYPDPSQILTKCFFPKRAIRTPAPTQEAPPANATIVIRGRSR